MDIRVPHSWLREIVKITKSPKDIALRVSSSGPSVERVRQEGGDSIYDVEITTNRPDAFSVLGFAREVAVILGISFPEYLNEKRLRTRLAALRMEAQKNTRKTEKGSYSLSIDIQEPSLCPRYCGAILDHVVIRPSPEWLRKRLEACGVRSINNIVDITNYVMLEYGQPMHAFDADKLIAHAKQKTVNLFKKHIVVRRARKGETIKTLDGEVKKLNPSVLVIADDAQAIAISGIKGGEASGIDKTTNTIVLEAASFDSVNIRKSSRFLELRTDASIRFEKGISSEYAPYAIVRAIELLKEHADAVLVTDVCSAYPKKEQSIIIRFSPHLLERTLGIAIDEKEAILILSSLGFCVKKISRQWRVDVPFYRRGDVRTPIDLIEEIARIYGYYRIPHRSISGPIPFVQEEPSLWWEQKTKEFLRNRGITEVITYSFIGGELFYRCNLDISSAVKLRNPLTVDFEYMRTSLIPGLLEILQRNEQKTDALQIFELSKVYLSSRKSELPDEKIQLAGAVTGKQASSEIFFHIKGILETLFHEWFGSSNTVAFRSPERGDPLDGASADIIFEKKHIGTIGLLSDEIRNRFGLQLPVIVFSIDFDAALPFMTAAKTYAPIPKYPAVLRDLAVVIEKKLPFQEIVSAIQKINPLIVRVELFDVFENAKLGIGKRSLAFHVAYMSPERTLRSDEIDKIHSGVVELLKERFNAEIRS